MSAWTATGRLVRLALRRDRVVLPIWLASICGLIGVVVAAETSLYQDADQRAAGAAFGAANTITRIADGPASGTSIGALSFVESYLVLAVFVALMSGQAVVRHTRLEEETGRAEIIGSSVVGRNARLSAAVIVAVSASLLVGLASAAFLMGNGLPAGGSWVAGAALAGTGIAFAGVAAVAAQVATSQRGANGIVGLALGLSFVLRAVGDAGGHVAPNGVELVSAWPSWLSPMGWGQQMRPYYQDNWGIAALFVVFAALLVVVAFRLSGRRDLGAGLIADRAGRATADRGLLRPWGLAWRLQRVPLLWWALGLAVIGAAMGSVGTSLDDFEEASPQFTAMLREQFPGAELVDVYAAFIMGFLGIAAAGYTVSALLRMRAEEHSGRLEPLLATATDRRGWLASHAAIAMGGTVAVLVAMGASGGVAYLAAGGTWSGAMGYVGAATAQIPAVLALGAFVVAVFAIAPRRSVAVAWAALAASFVAGQLGDMLKLPQAALNVSPFTHVPAIPAEPFGFLPIACLLAATAILAAFAAVAFRKRDLSIPA